METPSNGIMYNKMLEKPQILNFCQGFNVKLDAVGGHILGTILMPKLKNVFSKASMKKVGSTVITATKHGN